MVFDTMMVQLINVMEVTKMITKRDLIHIKDFAHWATMDDLQMVYEIGHEDYLLEKLGKLRKNFSLWLSSLDNNSLDNLVAYLNNYQE